MSTVDVQSVFERAGIDRKNVEELRSRLSRRCQTMHSDRSPRFLGRAAVCGSHDWTQV